MDFSFSQARTDESERRKELSPRNFGYADSRKREIKKNLRAQCFLMNKILRDKKQALDKNIIKKEQDSYILLLLAIIIIFYFTNQFAWLHIQS